jgi:hypothetical protein
MIVKYHMASFLNEEFKKGSEWEKSLLLRAEAKLDCLKLGKIILLGGYKNLSCHKKVFYFFIITNH